MADPRSRTARAYRAGLRALAGAAGLAVLAAGCASPSRPHAAPSRTSPSVVASARAAPTGTARPSDVHGPVTAAAKLVTARAAAFARHDRSGWLAGLDPAAGALRRSEATRYDDARAVPFTSWTATLDPASAERVPDRSGAPRWAYTVHTDYALAGLPAERAVRRDRVTFVHRGSGWRVAALTRLGGHPEIWELGRVAAVHAGRVTVLGVERPDRELRSVLALTRAAVPRVDAVWDGSWARGVVVTLPATAGDAAALVGAHDVDAFAAIATGDSATDADGGLRQWDRVVVNPTAWARVDAVGRRVVLTHELTHVATGSLGTVPTWTAEGFADYVGWRRTGVPASYVAQELAGRVHRGDVPADLPASAAFSARDADVAYEEAWLAARYVAHRYGERRLVRLYRALADQPGTTNADQDRALRATLGVSRSSFVASWRAYVRSTLR